MDAISQKGDLVEPLNDLLADKSKITSTGLKLKQIFLEVILTKYGGRSLEHISEGIRKVKPILDSQFFKQSDAQNMALETIFKAYSMDQLSAQDFFNENLFQVRSKVTKIVERFIQQGVLDTKTTIEWCIGVLEKHDKYSLDYTQCQLVLDLMRIQKDQKEHLTTIFV